jgi:Primase C terminal 2 (PriCT-2)/Bifunctional DNA primase/polymerase, N-terminal/Protein of unknown function (DUF3987)
MQVDTAQLVAAAEKRDALWAKQYRPIPVYSFNHPDPAKAGKAPLGPNWEKRARLDPPEAIRLATAVAHALNTGILCDGLRAVDIDIDDEAVAQRLRELAQEILGDTIIRRRSNSGRCLMPYRAAAGSPRHRQIVGTLGKIQVLGHGQQFVAHGVHPTGAPLFWQPVPPEDIALADLPEVTEDQVTAFLEAAAPLIGAGAQKGNGHDASGEHLAAEPEADIERITEAMQQIPNDGAADWESWNRTGMALWAATGGSEQGRLLWHQWSKRNASYDARATEARWQHYATSPPDQLGAGTLFYEAQQASEGLLYDMPDPAAAGEPADPYAVWDQPQPSPQPPPEPQARGPQDPSQSPPQDAGDDWPEPMRPSAFHGVLGEAVQAIAPHTEADPHALLVNLLVKFGNKIGRGPHYFVEETKHPTNLFALICGPTAGGRKDTASRRIDALFTIDPLDPWLLKCRLHGGLSSGEGLIRKVRDERWEKNKKGEMELVATGVTDKRLLVIESEFASVIAVRKREGNTLSAIIREAWDHGNLNVATNTNPQTATDAHISIIGHCTVDELQREIDRVDLVNGFINRFLIVAARQARSLPFGGTPDRDALNQIGGRIEDAVVAARLLGRVSMTDAAAAVWRPAYDRLKIRSGLLGAVLGRGQPQVCRLALLYALADQKSAIDLPHLEAALEVWRYCEDSARVIFGDVVGDPAADSILVFLRSAGAAGMSRSELHAAVNRAHSAARIQQALEMLSKAGRVRREMRIDPHRPGPPAEVWVYLRNTPRK